MTERLIHYHKNGGVTARLELILPDGGPDGFLRRHTDAVRDAFLGEVSAGADEAFEYARAGDRAYRFRPYTLRVEYAISGTGKKRRGRRGGEATLSVSYLCTAGRRVVFAGVEAHRFRRGDGGYIYLGTRPG